MIYFIQAQTYPYLIKIGFTAASVVFKRFEDLNNMNAVDLRLILDIPGTLQDEQFLHLQFSAERKKGEWFLPSKKLLKFILEKMKKKDISILQKPNKKDILTKPTFTKLNIFINRKGALNKFIDELINEKKKSDQKYSNKINTLLNKIKRLQKETKQFWLEKYNTKNMPIIKNLKKGSAINKFSNHCQIMLNKML